MILAAESEAASRQHMHCVPAYKIHDELQAAEVPPEGNQTLTYYWWNYTIMDKLLDNYSPQIW